MSVGRCNWPLSTFSPVSSSGTQHDRAARPEWPSPRDGYKKFQVSKKNSKVHSAQNRGPEL
jgi:hypothetical protein